MAQDRKVAGQRGMEGGDGGGERETEEEGERRFNNLRLWEVGGWVGGEGGRKMH